MRIFMGAERVRQRTHIIPVTRPGRLRQLIFCEFAPPTRNSYLLRSAHRAKQIESVPTIADCAAAAEVDRYLCDRVF